MARAQPYQALLAPGRIGTLELRNRICMSPMGSNLAESDGHCGERIQRYYEARAAGGAGLLIVGVGAIAYPAGACNPNQIAISTDDFLPGLEALARRVKAHGARIAIQLQHAGKVATRDIACGRPMWVPSVPEFKAGDLTRDLTREEMHAFASDYQREGAGIAYHEMTLRDIEALKEQFALAADRAKRAGFDAVELHAGHGYLLSGFLSPISNQRDDDYGGDIANRARLLVEVIRAVKDRVSADFPVWCRLDAVEFSPPGGITRADGQRAAELAAEAGVDAIHVTAYADATTGAQSSPSVASSPTRRKPPSGPERRTSWRWRESSWPIRISHRSSPMAGPKTCARVSTATPVWVRYSSTRRTAVR